MVAQILECNFSPSEMRIAAVLACIIYEERTIRTYKIPKELDEAIKTVEEWLDDMKMEAGKENGVGGS